MDDMTREIAVRAAMDAFMRELATWIDQDNARVILADADSFEDEDLEPGVTAATRLRETANAFIDRQVAAGRVRQRVEA